MKKKLLITAILTMMATTSAQAISAGGLIWDVTNGLARKALGKPFFKEEKPKFILSDKELNGIAEDINKTLPITINNYSRFDNLTYLGDSIMLYRLTLTTVSSVNAAYSLPVMQSRFNEPENIEGYRKSYCSNPDYAMLSNAGVVQRTEIYLNDGIYLGSFQINKGDCA
jgi:hypothetical protein